MASLELLLVRTARSAKLARAEAQRLTRERDAIIRRLAATPIEHKLIASLAGISAGRVAQLLGPGSTARPRGVGWRIRRVLRKAGTAAPDRRFAPEQTDVLE